MQSFKPLRTPVGLVLGGISLLLLVGCGGGKGSASSGSTNGGGDNPPLVSGTSSLVSGVQVLDPATEGQIATSDSTSVTFTSVPSSIAGLNPGGIFIAQNTARKVVSVTIQNGNAVIQTVTPEFSEVFKTLQFSATVPLSDQYRVPVAASPKARLSPSPASGVTITTDRQGNTYTIRLTDTVFNGTIILDQPQVEVQFNYGLVSDQYARIHFKTGETVDLTLSTPDLSSSLIQDLPLLEFQIPVPVTGGTVTVAVSLTLHFEADGSARLITGIHQGLSYDAGLTATLNPVILTPTNRTTHDFNVIKPQFTGEINAVVAVDPDIDAKLLQYSLAGITNRLGVAATARATADLTNGCARLQATAELSSEAYVMLPNAALALNFSWDTFSTGLDISMKRYAKELFRIIEPIYDSGDQCVVSNTPPVADAGADITANTNATVLLNGLGSHDPGGTITSYAWTQLDGIPITLIDSTTATPSFTAPSIPGTITLRLTVTDNNGATASDDLLVTVVSQTEPVAPGAPTGVSATAGDGQVTLSWASVSGATAYNVYRASVSGVTPVNYSALPGGVQHTGISSPFIDTGLMNETTYYFVVTAVNGSGESVPSDEVSATPLAGTPSGAFSPTGSMSAARYGHTATLLPNGKVLIAGGTGNIGINVCCAPILASVEIYDSATGAFSSTGSMTTTRGFGHTATLLANGKVLIVGGTHNGGNYLASAELYDPVTGISSPTGSMTTPRRGHTATLLANGQVLIVGGNSSISSSLASAELYNPATGTFSPTGSTSTIRSGHTATLLSNGQVLITGGLIDANAFLTTASSELYNLATGTFITTASMTTARYSHTATLLSNGKVLIAGGVATGHNYLVSVELYDPATGAFSQTGSMGTVRLGHTATPLSASQVLIAGGINTGPSVASAELYNGSIGTFSPTGSMSVSRTSHTATLLPNGKVLIAGGFIYTGDTVLATAELFK